MQQEKVRLKLSSERGEEIGGLRIWRGGWGQDLPVVQLLVELVERPAGGGRDEQVPVAGGVDPAGAFGQERAIRIAGGEEASRVVALPAEGERMVAGRKEIIPG